MLNLIVKYNELTAEQFIELWETGCRMLPRPI